MNNKTHPFVGLLFTFIFSLVLASCDNKSNTANNNPLITQKSHETYKKETILTGRVSNKKTSIRTGEIKATDSKNKLIATAEIDKNSHYALTIPAGTKLPIILSYSSTAKNSDKLTSVAIYSSLKKYDINDLTTLIAKKAKSLGGYNHSNMSIAADSTVGVPDANKTSTGFRGDPTKQYGGWH